MRGFPLKAPVVMRGFPVKTPDADAPGSVAKSAAFISGIDNYYCNTQLKMVL